MIAVHGDHGYPI